MVDVVVDVADGGGDTGNAVVAGRVVVVEGAEMAAAFLLTGVGVVAAAEARNLRAPAQMLGGCLALMVGAGVTIGAIETGSAALLLLGTGCPGPGSGRRSWAPTAPWWPWPTP